MNKVLPFEYTVRKSKRAKNILIHVEMDGSVVVVVPWRVAKRYAERFVWEKRDWILKMREKNALKHVSIPRLVFQTGEKLPFFGEQYELSVVFEPQRKRSFLREKDEVVSMKVRDEKQARDKLVGWYREKSRDYFTGEAISAAGQIGEQVREVKVLNTKSQWGSCNKGKKILTFQWRLALGPREVADYVVAHEVAHLIHANHSKAFWATVEELLPDYKKWRKWLRASGHELVL